MTKPKTPSTPQLSLAPPRKDKPKAQTPPSPEESAQDALLTHPLLDPQILQMTDTALFVYKPAGLTFHQQGDAPGVIQRLRALEAAETLPPLGELYPVHRLDRVSSGVLLFARTKDAAREIAEAFQARQVEKLYVALAHKKPNKKQGNIIGDMERTRRGAWKLKRSRQDPAFTHFTSHAIPDRRPGLRLFLLHPKTGKTHQIRVAMKSLGAPILGDPLYGPAQEARLEARTYLHAASLSIPALDLACFCPPLEGPEFFSAPLRACWQTLFPDPAHALPNEALTPTPQALPQDTQDSPTSPQD